MREGRKTKRARELRSNMTDAEQKLWRHLRMRQVEGFRFRRQHPVGPYITDFACLDPKLIVEVDGGQHAESCLDSARDRYLHRVGFTVLRFWNNDVLQNPEEVVEAIMLQLKRTRPHPGLPPQAEEGDKQRPQAVVGEADKHALSLYAWDTNKS